MDKLKNRIDEIISRSNHKQADIAKIIDLSPSMFSDIINGIKPIPVWVAFKLEKLIGLDARSILQDQLTEKIEDKLSESLLQDLDLIEPISSFDYEMLFQQVKDKEDYRLSTRQVSDGIGINYQHFLRFTKGKPLRDSDVTKICNYYGFKESKFKINL